MVMHKAKNCQNFRYPQNRHFECFFKKNFGFLKNRKKKIKFFEKNFIIKKCAYGPKMKPRQVLGKYFEVYGQAD